MIIKSTANQNVWGEAKAVLGEFILQMPTETKRKAKSNLTVYKNDNI